MCRFKEKRSTNKKRVTFKFEQSSKKQKTEVDWNRFTRLEERDGEDEECNDTYMTAPCSCNNNKDKINITEDDYYVYWDSCASKCLFILREQSFKESFVYLGGSIQTTGANAQIGIGLILGE